MAEWALLITMMTARHDGKIPAMASEFRPSSEIHRTLSTVERQELRQAVERIARESAGNMIQDKESRLFIPDTKQDAPPKVAAAVR